MLSCVSGNPAIEVNATSVVVLGVAVVSIGAVSEMSFKGAVPAGWSVTAYVAERD